LRDWKLGADYLAPVAKLVGRKALWHPAREHRA
jgi:hypothetical protein